MLTHLRKKPYEFHMDWGATAVPYLCLGWLCSTCFQNFYSVTKSLTGVHVCPGGMKRNSQRWREGPCFHCFPWRGLFISWRCCWGSRLVPLFCISLLPFGVGRLVVIHRQLQSKRNQKWLLKTARQVLDLSWAFRQGPQEDTLWAWKMQEMRIPSKPCFGLSTSGYFCYCSDLLAILPQSPP